MLIQHDCIGRTSARLQINDDSLRIKQIVLVVTNRREWNTKTIRTTTQRWWSHDEWRSLLALRHSIYITSDFLCVYL